MSIKQPVRIRRFKGTDSLMRRVGLIEELLPKKPIHPRTRRTLDYHSQIYQQAEELIGICRKVFEHMKDEVAKRDAENLKLTEVLYEMTRKHGRLKDSNKLLRQGNRQAAPTPQWEEAKRLVFIKDVKETDQSIISLAAKHGVPESTGRTWARNEGLMKGRRCEYRERV